MNPSGNVYTCHHRYPRGGIHDTRDVWCALHHLRPAIAIGELLGRELHTQGLFTARILIGLEFFVAADLLKTILEPTLQDLAVLGSLVTVGTIVSYFPGKEASEPPDEQNAG